MIFSLFCKMQVCTKLMAEIHAKRNLAPCYMGVARVIALLSLGPRNHLLLPRNNTVRASISIEQAWKKRFFHHFCAPRMRFWVLAPFSHAQVQQKCQYRQLAIRNRRKGAHSLFWASTSITSHLIVGNAWGCRATLAIEACAKTLLGELSIKATYQVPNSPKASLLDLRVWAALQSVVKRLPRRQLHDPGILSTTVLSA